MGLAASENGGHSERAQGALPGTQQMVVGRGGSELSNEKHHGKVSVGASRETSASILEGPEACRSS